MPVFLISTFLLVLTLISKIYFLSIEGFESVGTLGMASLIILMCVLLVGLIYFFRSYKFEKTKIKSREPLRSSYLKILLGLCVLVVGMSFYINFNKEIFVWDSVALYDARAKYISSGINFSDMVDLSKYDPQNSYYYVLYPPHTSIIHHFWYKLGVVVPIGVYYSFLLLLLGLSIYLFVHKKLGIFAAILLTFITISNDTIFSTSLAGYTNLPFLLQFLVGIFLLADFLEDEQEWKYFYGTALIVTSQWIRYLEPLWLGITLALLIVNLQTRNLKKKIIFPIFMGICGFVEYGSWGNFVSSFGEKTEIVRFSIINFLEPLFGIFTGSLLAILSFFLLSWGYIFLIYLFAFFGTIDIKKNCMKFVSGTKMERFFKLIFIFTTAIFFMGLYFVSFQSTWWNTLGGSLKRSSTFLIPLAGFIILSSLVKSDKSENANKHEKNKKNIESRHRSIF